MSYVIKGKRLNYNVKQALIILSGIVFMWLMAYRKVHIPSTVIQMSLQSLSISLLVIMLGRKAFLVVLLYLILAMLGLPVLAEGTANSTWYLMPSAGYYFGFLVSSYLLSKALSALQPKHFLSSWSVLAINETTILFVGFLFLSYHFGITQAWTMGVWTYLFGATLKITIATLIYLVLKRKGVAS